MANNRLSNAAQYWGGRAKETVGRLTGNRRTEFEGIFDQTRANVKDTGLRARDAFRRQQRRGLGRGFRGGFRGHPQSGTR